MSNTLINISTLKNNYQTYLQAQNSSINAFAPNSFWDIDAGSMASVLFDLYMNLQIVLNTIFPQYSSGDSVDQWLYSRGLPARIGQSYGTINVLLTSPTASSGSPFTIPINTVFIDSTTGNEYQTLQQFILTDNTTSISLYALEVGNVVSETVDSTLSNTTIDATVTVQSCTVGSAEETDQEAITRILQAIQVPLSGARSTDYSAYCLLAEPNIVTDSIVIPAVFSINDVNLLGVFPLVGSSIGSWQLDQGILSSTTYLGYTRQAGSDVLDTVTTYIENQRLVGLTPVVGYCATYIVPALTATVSLDTGYSLTDNITINSQDEDGTANTVTMTIEKLIQREIRRAVCSQAFGGTIIGTGDTAVNVITIDSLITNINSQLSSSNGYIAQILINLVFNVTDITVPSASEYIVSTDPYIAYTYDFSDYSSITVIAV